MVDFSTDSELSRLFASRGGHARARALTKKRRIAIAKKASMAAKAKRDGAKKNLS